MSDERKPLNEWTRKELEAVPLRENWHEEVRCSAVVLLPQRTMHDSGYGRMDFVAIDDKDVPICRLSGCSDVLNLDGIGGYGYKWLEKTGGVPHSVRPVGWNVDMLYRSKLLRFFCREDIICGMGLSSMEIFAVPRDKEPPDA